MRAGAEKVVIGMSGGVDSSVAAMLLKRQGYQVEGLFMVNWQEDEEAYCSAADDLQDARTVCDKLGIPLHQVDFSTQYRQQVFDYFLDEYRAGRTPNPDVLCNREIKFGSFFDYAIRLGADYIATGHYARVDASTDGVRLLKGLDKNKDQSYFLHQAPATALRQTLFPLGDLDKTSVRKLALEHGLHNHARKDSTGICFIGERPFKEFLARYIPAQPGDIITDSGKLISHHDGLMYHTLGQRQGLRIGGLTGYPDGAWYVIAKNMDTNELIISQDKRHPLLMSESLTTGPASWIDKPQNGPMQVKIRYRQADQDATVHAGANSSVVVFAEPQRAATPGQFAVFYHNDVCLGGAVIEELHQCEALNQRQIR